MVEVHSVITPLHEGRFVSLVDIRWRASCGDISPEFQSPRAEITFQRRGTFMKHLGRQERAACDPNTLVFINADEPYRMSHPDASSGEHACTALLLDRDMLAGLMRELVRRPADNPAFAFSFDDGPNPTALVMEMDQLTQLARSAPGQEALQIEERTLMLARRAIETAARFHESRPRKRGRPSTQRVHAALAQDVKELLARRFREPLKLADIAGGVHAAPTHLCSVFKQQTGVPIHQYLTRLRLAAARERILDGQPRLADLAQELGFADQSHLTNCFRREYGLSPAKLRGLTQDRAHPNAADGGR